ncbi:unnamed protein product [Aureobasidium mustum]|uniref:Uncharacterized protein n=1 Tax=Aureobasidium mustum TaxID=2773714 RepID=A0A9N8K8K2_9PEZI|nr:unnamed protein product [Aureobasidium mustum]
MVSNSKNCSGAVNGSSNAINLARPVRSNRNCSLPQSRHTFAFDDSDRETVADALAHLLPAAEVRHSSTTTDPVMMNDSNSETESSASPLAPSFSPLTPARTNGYAIIDPEIPPLCDKHIQDGRSPDPKLNKRKASADIPVTPPPRHLRQKTSRTTTTFKPVSKPKSSSAPKATAASKTTSAATTKKAKTPAVQKTSQALFSSGDYPEPRNLEGSLPVFFDEVRGVPRASQSANPFIALARNIQSPDAFITAAAEADSITLGSDDRIGASTTDNMSASQRAIHDISTTAHQLLRRQRVLIHDYDTFDVQTYNPSTRVDRGTAALRQFVGILREGLNNMEADLAALDGL